MDKGISRGICKMKVLGLVFTLTLTGGVYGCGDDDAGEKGDDTNTNDGTPDAGVDSGQTSSGGGGDTDGTTAGTGGDIPVDDVEARVEEILSGLTMEEKAGQMVQAQFADATTVKIRNMCIGSVFNGGEEPVSPNVPENWANAIDALQAAAMEGCGIPILYGFDAVHGAAKVIGATVFPHNIGIGAAGDADLARRVGQATARECRGVGVHMTFAPTISVVRDERWGRTYEGFGETPEINAEMGAAMVEGLQGMGDLKDPGAIAATAKHYVGDGGTTNGINAGENDFGDATMRAIHLPPFQAAVEAGVAAIMPSYHKWTRNDAAIPITFDTYLISTVLKEELGFDGFCLSDYDAIPAAAGMKMATYTDENVRAAVTAGVDMAMIAADDGMDQFQQAIYNGMENGDLAYQWIDDAVRRILRIKVRMGLFENPYSNQELRAKIWSAEHQELAREAVRKSLVLLKNDNAILPLASTEAVSVVGSYADMMGVQAGGWTVGWQGLPTYTVEEVMGETIRQGLEQVGGANVTWDPDGVNIASADKVVVVIGEQPYAEGEGDHNESDHSIFLSGLDNYEVLTAAVASGKPIVLVLVTGRPVIIDPTVLDGVDAIVAAWLPGSRGIGVADVLYGGEHNFTGKLTHTWPATFDQIPVNINKQPDEPGFDASEITPLYPFGHGLTY